MKKLSSKEFNELLNTVDSIIDMCDKLGFHILQGESPKTESSYKWLENAKYEYPKAFEVINRVKDGYAKELDPDLLAIQLYTDFVGEI